MYLERFKLGGRTALVTGGGRGIGLACADALAEAGARVIVADRDPEVAASGLDFLLQKGHRAESVILDVTDSRAVENARPDGGPAASRRARRLVCVLPKPTVSSSSEFALASGKST